MTRAFLAFALALVLPAPVLAQPAAGARKLLYPADLADVPAALRPHVERIIAADQKVPDLAAAKFDGAYLRICRARTPSTKRISCAGGWARARWCS